ncbi:MAG: glycosyltransferase family 4 protein [Gallionellaceae bacterium]|nr:glycosyltransferase family 4 protein [Gallionellaceae bacterium]
MSLYSPILAALVTMLLTFIILHSKLGRGVQDIPNERSLHQIPIPRTGGVALIMGVLAGWLLIANQLTWWVLLPLIALFAVSLLDDIFGLSVHKRMFVHLVASVVLVAGSALAGNQGVVVALAILFLTVWMINLYNFMDGSDGLAGGMALFGFTFFGIAALMNHNETFAMLNFSISAAAMGFLFSNFYPAKIFMGDAGSIPLGFLAAAMGLWGWQQMLWEWWFPIFVFSPFIVDASITLIKRALRGVKITEAHREHYYQRAIQLVLGHRSVALIEYVLMLAVGGSALFVLREEFPVVVIGVWCLIFAFLMSFIEMQWKHFVSVDYE